MGGSNRRWRRLSIGGGFASNGVAVVASSVAMVRWVVIMGMREREMKRGKERERERKKNKKNEKETREWSTQDGRYQRRGDHR